MGRRWVSRPLVAAVVILLGLGVVGVPAAEASPANITVSLSVSPPPPAAAGTTVTYTLAVGNSGTSASGTLTITDTFNWYVANSATCGSVPNCTVQEHPPTILCPASPPTNAPGCGRGVVVVTWTITSVAGSASGLDLSAQVTSVGDGDENQASWLGDGCTTPGSIQPVGFGIYGGCTTNQLIYPGALVLPSETNNVTGTYVFGPGPSVTPGQTISYGITLMIYGTVASGTITVSDSIPSTANATLVANSATCGTAPGCTVSVTPTAACSSGPCPGSLITWIITSIEGSDDTNPPTLTLSFAVTVGPSVGGSVVNQALWNGPVNPPVAIPGTSILTSSDGCVYGPTPAASGCLLPSLTNPIVAATPPPPVPAPPPPVPTPVPITQATTVHTGEPWAGSQPMTGALFGVGVSLLAAGFIQRRRRRT